MQSHNTILIVIFLAFALAGTIVSPAAAGENILGLNDSEPYDIYVGDYNDALSVIRNVDITDLRDVGGTMFLVIQTDSFVSRRSMGLIQLSAVKAILPSQRTSVLPATTININKQ